jgi:MraZ protein
VFRGVNPLSLDAKGRITMPARHRARLEEHCRGHLVITIDREDPCLLIYPLPEWERIEAQIDALPTLHKKVRRLQRLLVGHAADCEMDGQGRVLLPPPLRDFARLERRVVLIGQGKKFELWDEQTWNQQLADWLAEEEEGELPSELDSLSL